jgi:hypothetical protein
MFITVQAQSRWDHANLYLIKPNAHQNSYKSSRTLSDTSPKNFATDLQLYPSEENNSIETVSPTPLLFNTVISSVSDKVDDVPSQYSFIDIVYAEIRQINLDTLQFEMKVKSTIPLNPGNDVVVYLWMIDTDLNPNTGQRHSFVGSEYNIRAAFYDSHWQGWVDPIDQRPGGGQCPVFVDNNTISILVKRSQIGNATRFSWEVSASDDRGGYDGADSYAICQLLSEIPSSDVVSEILLSPSQLILSNGISSGKLSISVKDVNGGKLSFSSAKFFVDYPAMINITTHGEVLAIPGKFGHCWITAKVDGIISSNHVEVAIGSTFLLPPILLLSPDNPTGKLTVEAYDAYGNKVFPKTIEFSSSSPSVATVDNAGLVTAIRPPKTFGETPYISAKVDGISVPNAAVVRVTRDNLGITLKALPWKHITFYIPEQPIQGFDYQKIFKDYDIVRITDIAYELESDATGVVPFEGSTLFLVNDPGHGADGTVPCGLSGNPIRLGTDVDKSVHNSCMIIAYGFGFPQWFVYFHEMGHDFTLEGNKVGQFFFGGANHTVVYVEGLASALAMYAVKMMRARSSMLNISDYIMTTLMSSWHFGSTPHLDNYLKNGAHYDAMTPDVLDEMIDVICTKYGYDSLYRFYSLFLPRDVPFTFTIDSDTKQATVFVAALSAATGVDLRTQFKEWGFPIDDNFYTRIWNEVNQLVNQRMPLVSGVKNLWSEDIPGHMIILDNQTIPIASGDKNTIPVPSVVVAAREFGKGRVVASIDSFFKNRALKLFDNKVFTRNVIEWLGKLEGRKILIPLSHREWYGGTDYNDFKQMLENFGYNVTMYYGSLTPDVLSRFNVLIIGNAWDNFTRDEISAILNFVNNGGGILLAGQGWSWPGHTLDNYPMNILGEYFGVQWIDSHIKDSDPQDNYEGLPIFHTFYPDIEVGTISQAITYINKTLKKYATDLPFILENNSDIRWKYFTANELLVTASLNLRTNSSQRPELYNFYKQLFLSYPQLFRRNVTYDKNTENAMAWIRERSYFAFTNTILLHSKGLTPQTVREIAETLGLSGKYLDIWMNFQVMILDNGMSSEKQLDFIYHYLSLIPRELHNLRFISIRDFLGALPDNATTISFPFSVAGFSRLTQQFGAVNVFSVEVGSVRENEFPEDVKPYETDVFSIVVAHEINHVVDAYYISRNSTLAERKKILISRAGYDHMNYLRSMLPDGFFIQYPQEFFASIANEWFANTTHTLKLALVRFDKGYKEPLNQFIFFADVYSRGGKTTFFYTIDVEGNIQRKEILILRDDQDRIIGLVDGKTVYRFTLDSEGYVISYFVSLDTTPPTTTHNYDGLWHTSDITIVLKGSDDLSGVAETFYRINSGPVKRVSVDGQPVISTEGANNTLEYWSVDNAGNEEPHKLLTGIKLDKTPPTGSITINSGNKYTNTTKVILMLSSHDATSGVAEIRFSSNNVTWTPWEPFTTVKSWVLEQGDGLKYVYVQFRDRAKLVSQVYYATIMLDTIPPVVNVVGLQIHDTGVTISWSGSDNLSGIDHYEIRLDEGRWINVEASTNYTFENLIQGVHMIYIRAVDRAGNMNTVTQIMTVTQTTTIPTTTTTMITSTATTAQSTTVTQTTSVTTTTTVSQTKVETYTTITQTQSTATETAWMSTIVLVVILLLVGMLIGYAIKRR